MSTWTGANDRKMKGYCIVFLGYKYSEIEAKEEVIDMPRGDGRGPDGMGPMTGRQAGFCAGYDVPGYANPIAGRGRGRFARRGFGGGGGRGRGWGRGFGRGNGWIGDPNVPYADPYYGNPYPAAISSQQEADMLKSQAKAMQEEMSVINDRIKELESSAKEKK